MPESEENVIINLRSVLLATMGGIPINKVEGEYKEIYGENVPLSNIGCNNLLEFLKNHPEDFVFYGDHVLAVIKPASQHIADLVNNQKNRKKRRRKVLNEIPEHVLHDHSKAVNMALAIGSRRYSCGRRNKSKFSRPVMRMKAAEMKPKIISDVKPKLFRSRIYNPNNYKYAVNVFKNFISTMNNKKVEEKFDDADYTNDIVADLRC